MLWILNEVRIVMGG